MTDAEDIHGIINRTIFWCWKTGKIEGQFGNSLVKTICEAYNTTINELSSVEYMGM